MKDDIQFPKVEDVIVAVVQDIDNENQTNYYTYLFSHRADIMEGIIITSKGYGKNESTGEMIRTSTLRHTIEVLLPGEFAKIEPIMPEVFGLTNEYHISFWAEDVLYDKKFIFLPESIREENMLLIEQLGKRGVIIS